MDAALIDLGLVRVADPAVHLGHRVAVTRVVLVEVGVAALARERGMHGLAEAIRIHKEGNRRPIGHLLDHILVAMAAEAGLVGLLIGRGRLQGRGRQEEPGEEGEQDTTPAASG